MLISAVLVPMNIDTNNGPCLLQLLILYFISILSSFTLYSAAELEKKEAECEDSRLREYHCPVCDKDLHLSSIGTLRHKRMHAKMK